MSATSKRFAQIILPKFDNDGNSLVWHHNQYQKAFAYCFGGFTAYDVRGGWMNDDGKMFHDESVAYHIAMDDDEGNMSGHVEKLRQLADAAAHEMRQEAIFIALPSGKVEFRTK